MWICCWFAEHSSIAVESLIPGTKGILFCPYKITVAIVFDCAHQVYSVLPCFLWNKQWLQDNIVSLYTFLDTQCLNIIQSLVKWLGTKDIWNEILWLTPLEIKTDDWFHFTAVDIWRRLIQKCVYKEACLFLWIIQFVCLRL